MHKILVDVDAKLSQKDVCLNGQSSGLEFHGFLVQIPQNISPLRKFIELDKFDV